MRKLTRIILHYVKSQASNIVVAVRDTDMLVLLLPHFAKMSCPRVWMKAGTSTKQKYIPIHFVAPQFNNYFLSSLPAFHSLTGSDPIYFLASHTKKSSWSVFKEYNNLLSTFDKGQFSDQICGDLESFICKVC